ncbi:MAG: hypothetical protein QOH24_1501 [Verrucomicrobiota bacterium]
MKAPRTNPVTPPHDTWLQNCGFQSRHDPVTRAVTPGILSQNIDKLSNKAAPTLIPVEDKMGLPSRDIFPLREFEPAATPSTNASQPARMADHVVSELRALRKLSAGVYCPETSRDCIPEIVLFVLIALLGMAWPILSMFHAMGRH